MDQNELQEQGRRSSDMHPEFALSGAAVVAHTSAEPWRELVSAGITFGFGLAALAGLALLLY